MFAHEKLDIRAVGEPALSHVNGCVDALSHKATASRIRQPMTTLHIPYLTALTTYISYGFLFLFGHLRDTIRSLVFRPPARDKVSFCRRTLVLDCWPALTTALSMRRVMRHCAEILKISTHVVSTVEYRYYSWQALSWERASL